MGSERRIKSKKISEHQVEDVFTELCRLELLISSNHEHYNDYAIIRLVTIIEQFLRNFVEDKLYVRTDQFPKTITLNSSIFEDIIDRISKSPETITKEMVVSLSYLFQSTEDIIKIMSEYPKRIFDDSLKQVDFDRLYESRHDLVHGFKRSRLDAKHYHNLTEKLIKRVLNYAEIEHPSFGLLKIEALMGLGEYKKAIEYFKGEAETCFNQAIEQKPDRFIAHYDKGLALQELKEYTSAVVCFDKALSLVQNDDDVQYIYRGMSMQKAKKQDGGTTLRSFGEWSKGESLFEMGKYSEALDCFNKVIELDPRDADAFLYKGRALEKLQKNADALKCFDNATWLDPNNPFAYLRSGILLQRQEKHDEAVRYFEKANHVFTDSVSAYPDDGVLHYGNGLALYALKKHHEAIVCFTKALESNLPFADAYRNMGVALQDLQKYDAAKECIDKIKKLEEDLREAKEYLNKTNTQAGGIPEYEPQTHIHAQKVQNDIHDT